MTDTGTNIPPGYRLATYQDGYEAGYADARATDRAALEAEIERLRTVLGVIEGECQHWADITNDAGESNLHARHARLARESLAAQDRTGGSDGG
jgi:hypothetical protein